jgi:hypothetical protein
MRTRVAVVMAALCATGLVGAGMMNRASATDRPVVSQLGFYPGFGNVAGLNSLDSWLGRSAKYIVQFGDISSPSAFESSVWGELVQSGSLQTFTNSTTFVESVPLAFGNFVDASTASGQATARSQLQATANGSNDAAFRVAATYLRDSGNADAIIRLGWEFDGGWMPWSSRGNEALWVNAYRRAADIFRSVSPNFRFDWNGDPGYLQGQMSAYPGDNYVDIVGMDLYDKGMSASWNPSTRTWNDPAAAFATEIPNLRFGRDFAIAHGKQVRYPEWALASGGAESPNSAGNDDPAFIQGMYDWMSSLPSSGAGSLAYQSYFNEDTSNDGNHMLSHYPNAAARFRSLFGPSSSPSTDPPTTEKTTPTTKVPITAAPTTTTTERTTPTPTIPPVKTPVPVSPPPPVKKPAQTPHASRQVIAAGASARNIATETRWKGALSNPYVCCWANQGQYVKFSFVATGGPTNLALRYSAGNGSAGRKVELDGSVWNADATFPATSSWNSWSKLSLNARLAPGRHTLKIWFDQKAGSHNYINLDNLTVSPILVIPAGSSHTNIDTESRWAGAENAPYICCWGSQGQYVTFTFNAIGGSTNLALRYSAGNGDAHRRLELDGKTWAAGKTFPATADWNTWAKVSLNARLTPGRHTLKIWFDRNAGSDQFLNLDDLWVTGAVFSR